MNTKKVAAATANWVAAHQRRKHPRTSTEAFWATREIANARPSMIEAYASHEDDAIGSATRETLIPSDLNEGEEEQALETYRKPFDYYCVPASPAMQTLVDDVWTKWRTYQRMFSRFPEAHDQFLLSTCLSNIINAELTDPTIEGVTITRDKVRLSLHSRYRPQVFTKRFLVVVDGLVGCGMLQQVKGPAWHGPVRPTQSRQTIIHSTEPLRALMALYGVADVRDTKWDRTGQEIILRKKDQHSALEEYSDLDVIANGYRAEVRAISHMLQSANLIVLNRPGLPYVDDRDRFVQRQFTYQSWTSGGRLLGGFWAPMSKEDRHARILINGESTVELDYNSLPYHCLYALAKSPMPAGDVYAIPGLDPGSRAGIKKLMLSLTFDKKANRIKFPKGSWSMFSEVDRRAGASVVIAKIRAHHSGIGHLLGADKGHNLQFIESQVLVALLLKIREEGLIGLPIHDCLLVPVSRAERIQTIMEETSLLVAGIRVPVKRQ
jgi:hypothetical protein